MYNPIVNPKIIDFKKDRIEYWLGVGAQTSPTVHNLFVKEGILKDKKRKVVFLSGKRKAKMEKEKPAPAGGEAAAPQAPAEPAK
jgi:small subunit ribosomal protein S16